MTMRKLFTKMTMPKLFAKLFLLPTMQVEKGNTVYVMPNTANDLHYSKYEEIFDMPLRILYNIHAA